MKKILCALLALLLTAGIAACSQAPAPGREPYRAHIGETELTAMPRRVVTMSRALTESVCALGYPGRLVGVAEGSDAPAPAKDLPAVGTVLNPDQEALLSLKPDAVLTPAALPAETAEALTASGCTVVVLPYADTLDAAVENWSLICTLMAGDTAGANMEEQLRRYASGVLDALKEGITEEASAVFLMRLPNVCATGGTWLDDVLGRIGLANAAAGGENWIYAPAEGESPAADVIFYDESIDEGEIAAGVWQNANAVAAGRMIPIDGSLLEAQTPRSLLAVAEAVRAAFPDADFPEADILLEQEPPEVPEPTALEKLRGKLGI